MTLNKDLEALADVLLQRSGPHSSGLCAGQIDRARDHGMPDRALSLAEREALDLHVPSDRDNAVAEQFGLAFPVTARVQEILAMVEVDLETRNGNADAGIPVPATYLIDRDRAIRFGGAEPDYRTRIEPADVLAALRALNAGGMPG